MSTILDPPVSGPSRPDGHAVTAPGRTGALDDGMEVDDADDAAGRDVVAAGGADATDDDAADRDVAVPDSDDGVGQRVEAEIRDLVDRLARLLDHTRAPATAAIARDRVQVLGRLTGLADAATADAVAVLRCTGGISADGASSTADWVKANTGRSGRDAARVARLATDLPDLPATRDALATGTITDEAADAIVRAARDGRLGTPDQVDARLAPVATRSTPEALRADIRDRQHAVDAAAMLRDENRQHAVRDLRLWRETTGIWQLHGRLPDELGQTLRTALDAFDQADPGDTPPDQRRRPGQRLADALGAMTGAVLDGGTAPGTGGITRPHLSVIVHADTVSTDLTRLDTTEAGNADTRLGDRADAETGDLARRNTTQVGDPDDPSAAPAIDDPRWADLPAGDLPWGGKLSPQAVRRICCDAAVSRIITTADSQVLDVGRATRRWSGPQRRAVNVRDRGCRGPNCTRPIAWTQVHHLQWWRHHGPTAVDNGLALCHHCHRLVHDHGWTIDFDPTTATATWHSPDGTTITTPPHRQAVGSGAGATGTGLPTGSPSARGARPDAQPRGDPIRPPAQSAGPRSAPTTRPTTTHPRSPRSSSADHGPRDPVRTQPPPDVSGAPAAGGIPRP